jgi:hypothetical protein
MIRALPVVLLVAASAANAAAAQPKHPARHSQSHARRAPQSQVPKRVEPPPVAPIAREIESLSDDGPREARCRALTGYSAKPYSSCSAELLAHGEVVLVRVETECAGPSCKVEGWLFARGRAPLHVSDASGAFEATPSLETVVHDSVQRDARGQWTVTLQRIDAKTGAASQFADCMSPTLSPGGRFFVCRDKSGAVLRVPVGGGAPIVVVVASDDDRVDFAPEARVYPDPVVFRGDRLLTYERYPRARDGSETVTLPWSEP